VSTTPSSRLKQQSWRGATDQLDTATGAPASATRIHAASPMAEEKKEAAAPSAAAYGWQSPVEDQSPQESEW
jgi:hypothetical protein